MVSRSPLWMRRHARNSPAVDGLPQHEVAIVQQRQFPAIGQSYAVGAIKPGRSPALVAIIGIVAVAAAAFKDRVVAQALYIRHGLAPGVGRLQQKPVAHLPPQVHLHAVIHRETVGFDAGQTAGGETGVGNALRCIGHRVSRNAIDRCGCAGEQSLVDVAAFDFCKASWRTDPRSQPHPGCGNFRPSRAVRRFSGRPGSSLPERRWRPYADRCR